MHKVVLSNHNDLLARRNIFQYQSLNQFGKTVKLVKFLFKFNYLVFSPGRELHTWTGVRFNVSDSSIHLRWTKPPSGFLGVSSVKKYLILYNSNTANPVRPVYSVLWLPGDKTHVTISGLLPFTNYSLIVVAILTDESKRGNTGWSQEQTEEGGKTTDLS